MAQIILDIPDAFLPRLVNAVAARTRYEPILSDGTPNPLTKGQWAKQQMIRWARNHVIAFENEQDALNSRVAKTAEIEAVPIT